MLYLWVVFRIARMQSDGLQIKPAVKVDRGDDVPFRETVSILIYAGNLSLPLRKPLERPTEEWGSSRWHQEQRQEWRRE